MVCVVKPENIRLVGYTERPTSPGAAATVQEPRYELRCPECGGWSAGSNVHVTDVLTGTVEVLCPPCARDLRARVLRAEG